jgi:hypothetical protein
LTNVFRKRRPLLVVQDGFDEKADRLREVPAFDLRQRDLIGVFVSPDTRA